MTSDARSVPYPLEGLRKRESWRLESLQAELAEAARRSVESLDRRDALQEAHQRLAGLSAPERAAVIDPALAGRRLVYLRDLQRRVVEAAQQVVTLERAREDLRTRSVAQQVRFESIEAHRRSHFQEAVAAARRTESNEADRDWLARASWRQAQSDAMPEGPEGSNADSPGEET